MAEFLVAGLSAADEDGDKEEWGGAWLKGFRKLLRWLRVRFAAVLAVWRGVRPGRCRGPVSSGGVMKGSSGGCWVISGKVANEG